MKLVVSAAEATTEATTEAAASAASAASIHAAHSCTLCGKMFSDKSDFNGHIKAHLKEKLNTRRELKSGGHVGSAGPPVNVKPSPAVLVPEPLKRMLTTTPPSVMAELAACKPIPPDQSLLLLPKRPLPISEAMATVESMAPPDADADLMSFERELNRIDFHNDLSLLLDQIEKDFESPGLIGLPDISLDTPPDSDSETSDYLSLLMGDGEAESEARDLDLVSQLASPPPSLLSPPMASSPDSDANGAPSPSPSALVSDRLLSPSHPLIVQSPASLARVGRLPEKALDLLSHLPGKLFVKPAGSQARLVNVVKVEQSTTTIKDGFAMGLPNAGNGCAFINIECHEAGKDGAPTGKLIETFRAIDTGTEIKLIGVLGPEQESAKEPPLSPLAAQSVSVAPPVRAIKANSQCSVCNKTITTKNLARHMEKHVGKKQFVCGVCAVPFAQKSQLRDHATSHRATASLACIKCGELVPSKAELIRHRRRAHPMIVPEHACAKCKATFRDRSQLQRHFRSQHATSDQSATPNADKASNIRCFTCQRTFSRSSHLRRHERTAHTAAHVLKKRSSITVKKSIFLGEADRGALAEFNDVADIFDLANDITDEFYSPEELF